MSGIEGVSVDTLLSSPVEQIDPERCQSIFKIGSAERLLAEIKKKLNLHLIKESVVGMSVTEILESDMYGRGLGCMYHEMRNSSNKCSKARIIQWMSNICKHLNALTGLRILPGRHMAVQLNDGSRMIIENENVPLIKQDF